MGKCIAYIEGFGDILANKPGIQRTTQEPISSFFSDELSSDQRLEDPEKAFKVHTFYPILDTAIGQLTSPFEGQQLVTQNFSFLIPRNMCQLSDEELEESTKKLIQTYNGDLGEDLVTEVRSFRRQFLKELQDDSTVSVLDMYSILIDAKLQHQCHSWLRHACCS